MPQNSPTLFCGYSVGNFLSDLCTAFFTAYSIIIYTLVIGLSSFHSGIIILVAEMVNVVASPLVVIWSKGSYVFCFRRFGKRKSWYALGTLIVALSMLFMYMPFNFSENLQLAYYIGLASVFQVGKAIIRINHDALRRRVRYIRVGGTSMQRVQNTFTIISNITVYMLLCVMLVITTDLDPLKPNDLFLFLTVIVFVIIIGVFCSVIFLLIIKEDTNPTQQNSIGRQPNNWLWYHTALIYMFTKLFVSTTETLVPLYVHESLHLEPYTIASVPLIMSIARFEMSILSLCLIKVFGKRFTSIIAIALAVSGSVWIQLDRKWLRLWLLYLLATLFGGAASLFLAIVTKMISELDKHSSQVLFYEILNLVDESSFGISIMVIQSMVNSDEMYYANVLVISSGATALASGLLIWLYPLCSYIKLKVKAKRRAEDQEPRKQEINSSIDIPKASQATSILLEEK